MTGSFLVASAICRDVTGRLSAQMMLKTGSSLAVKSSSFKGNLDSISAFLCSSVDLNCSWYANISAQHCILTAASVGTSFFGPRMVRIQGDFVVCHEHKGMGVQEVMEFLDTKNQSQCLFLNLCIIPFRFGQCPGCIRNRSMRSIRHFMTDDSAQAHGGCVAL